MTAFNIPTERATKTRSPFNWQSVGQRQGLPPGPGLQADKPAMGAPCRTAGHVPWTRGRCRGYARLAGRQNHTKSMVFLWFFWGSGPCGGLRSMWAQSRTPSARWTRGANASGFELAS